MEGTGVNRSIIRNILRWSVSGWMMIAVGCPAEAHLVNSGLGPFYDGISHLLLSPEDIISVLGVALLAGLAGKAASRSGLFALTAAWLIGGIAASLGSAGVPPAIATFPTFLFVGALIASDRRLPPLSVGSIAASVGVWHGWLNGLGIAQSGQERLSLVGTVSTIFVVVSIAAAGVTASKSPIARIGFRVAGSWMAAIGLLMLGWNVRAT